MQKKILALSIVTALFWSSLVYSTPSTIFWTAGTVDIQPYKVYHITIDNYVDGHSNFPPDYGLTVGVLPFEEFQAEIGIDVLEPSDYPLYFNAKFGSPENSLFSDSPAWSFGMWNISTKSDVTDYDILQLAFTKTLPNNIGRIHLGGYYGITDNLKITATEADGDRGDFTIGYAKYSSFNGTDLV